jgi:hypothetical protein
MKRYFILTSFLWILIFRGNYVLICKDISKNPQYSKEIGKQYSTKEDFVLSKRGMFSRSVNLNRIQTFPYPPNEPISFPFRYKKRTLLGRLPKGSILEIKEIRKEFSFIGPNEIRFYFNIKYSPDSKYQNWKGTMGYDLVGGFPKPYRFIRKEFMDDLSLISKEKAE